MKVIFSNEQMRHQPEQIVSSGRLIASPEIAARAEILLTAARSAGLTQEQPGDYGLAPIAAVHTAAYLKFLEHIVVRWKRIPNASADVFPNVHPATRDDVYPASAVGQVGYHVYDGSCPITADTWDSARWSAWSAVHAAQEVLQGARACYALARPPGHHASSDLAGGFCYLNNSAIAAEVLRSQYDRVAILDVDVHHGNGTQHIFYERDDVLTISLHADPVRFYPFFWGAADEIGRGAGEGFNLNLPLPRGTGGDDYMAALAKAFRRIADFAPGALVIALGLDAYEGDPLAGLGLKTRDFGVLGERIAALDLPTVLVQEGGYPCAQLGNNLASVLRCFTT
ncbi:MAG TPA: histone deacetylase family protein [Woeseiaceae bacterium]|nr:histone deacetylase family protein [Woeseiaceae bacterium]